MDITFCIYNEDEQQIVFASANRTCMLVRNEEVIEIKGNSQHVGFNEKPEPFTNHKINVQKDDVIILYSDGYVDQFGGPKGRKFMRKQFQYLIKENAHKPMQEIGITLENTILEWKGTKEQTDDITVMGIRIS